MHGFSPEKRAFFVEAMGEERVKAMEARLFHLSKELEAHGVAFKMDMLVDDVVAFADAEAARLFGVFTGIAYNIIHSPELGTPEKLSLLRQAVADLATRISGGGGKAKTAKRFNPAAKYVSDLGPQRPAETKAAKELRATGAPGAVYAADIMDGRVIPSS